MDASTLITTGFILFAASGFQAVTGFGFALVSTPILFFMMPPKLAVMILVIPSFFAAWSAAHWVRKSTPWKQIGIYVFWTPLGIVLGLEVLDSLPVWAIKFALALLLVQVLLSKFGPDVLSKLHWTPLSALIAGIAGGSLGTSGPPVIAWAHSKDAWTLDQKRAATLWIFTLINLLRIPVYGLSGDLAGKEIWIVAGASIPLLLLGSYLGNALADKVSASTGTRIVQVAIIALVVTLTVGAIGDL